MPITRYKVTKHDPDELNIIGLAKAHSPHQYDVVAELLNQWWEVDSVHQYYHTPTKRYLVIIALTHKYKEHQYRNVAPNGQIFKWPKKIKNKFNFDLDLMSRCLDSNLRAPDKEQLVKYWGYV